MQPYIGGSFAPPLSDAKLAGYKSAVAALPASPAKDACASLLHCCGVWWGLPEPAGTKATAHPSGKGTIVAMSDGHKQALDEHIPWGHELDSMQNLFDGLPTGTEGEQFVDVDGGKVRRAIVTDPKAKAVRDMAFHLLWHVRELNLDREPLTADKL